MTRCTLAQFSAKPCSGSFAVDRAHWLPKQRLRHLGFAEDAIWDERVWTPACRAHHHAMDHGFLRVPRESLPAGLFEYAAEHGIEWMIDRDFGAVAA